MTGTTKMHVPCCRTEWAHASFYVHPSSECLFARQRGLVKIKCVLDFTTSAFIQLPKCINIILKNVLCIFFFKKKLAYFPFLFHSVVFSWLQELITRETLNLIHELSLSHTESLRFSETRYIIQSHRFILNEVYFLAQVYTHLLTMNQRLSSQRSALRVVLQIAQNLEAVSCSFRSARGFIILLLEQLPDYSERKIKVEFWSPQVTIKIFKKCKNYPRFQRR